MQKEKFKNTEQNSKSDVRIRSYRFALRIIDLVDALSNSSSNVILGNQLLRSATSIGANIIEAQAAS